MTAHTKLAITPTAIHDVFVVEPKVFGDERGWFTESFNAQDFAKQLSRIMSLFKTTIPFLVNGL